MKIAGIIRQDSGVGYYRLGQPIKAIDKVSKEKSRITPFTGTGKIVRITEGNPDTETWTDETLMEICRDAEIIWSTIIYDKEEMLKMLNLRQWSGAKWVVDIDDDLYNIPIDNPGKKSAEALRENMEICLSLADGVTVSTPRLEEVYRHLNDYIFINPNGQDIKFWDNLKKHNKPKPHKKVRIGWRGASGHAADVSLIKPALDKIMEDYNVEFVTLGIKPPFKSEHHEWVGCLEFPQTLARLNLDMAVVPLIDSPYNRCKSNIAVQEFGMLKIPVIASPVENQNNMPVKYAKSNYEWYWEMENLIKNKKMRKQEGENLYNHIKKEWSVDGFTPALMEWLKKLPRKEIKPDLT
jgi:hypothetical protein